MSKRPKGGGKGAATPGPSHTPPTPQRPTRGSKTRKQSQKQRTATRSGKRIESAGDLQKGTYYVYRNGQPRMLHGGSGWLLL